MSNTTLSSSNASVQRLEIPNEICLAIIRLAVDVPDRWEHPPGVQDYEHLSSLIVNRYEETFSTKRSLVRVCRRWNVWTTPLLYEHIKLASPDGLQKLSLLLDVASRPPTIQTSSSIPPLGHFIKRLDFLAGFEWVQLYPDPHPTYSPAPQLCKLSPNLVTLIIGNGHRFFPQLSDVVSPTLEYARIMTGFPMNISELATFMDHHPRLAYMHYPKPIRRHPVNWERRSWPSVREIACDDGWDGFPTGAFPNLQRLKMRQSLDLAFACSLVSIHGRSITSLYIAIVFGNWRKFGALQGTVNGSCPNLKELMFDMQYIEPWDPSKSDALPSNVQIPEIRVLGVRSEHKRNVDAELFWTYFYGEVLRLTTFFPNAPTVRFFDEENVMYLQKYPCLLMPFLEDCKSRGICAEDHEERPLSVQLSGI